MTMRSHWCCLAYSTTASQTLTDSTVWPVHEMPEPEHDSLTAATFLAATRSCASRNSCGSVGCISDMAL